MIAAEHDCGGGRWEQCDEGAGKEMEDSKPRRFNSSSADFKLRRGHLATGGRQGGCFLTLDKHNLPQYAISMSHE